MAFKMQCNDEFYLFFPTLDADREKEKKWWQVDTWKLIRSK